MKGNININLLVQFVIDSLSSMVSNNELQNGTRGLTGKLTVFGF